MNNQIENTHIIFNEFARTTLTNNEELNIKPSNIISLEDDLRIGPISSLKSKIELEARKSWFSKVLKHSIKKDQIVSNVEKDIEKINTILSNAKQNKVFIWSGNNSRDIIGAARILTKLKRLNVPLFMANFTEIILQTPLGKSFSPKSLVEVNSSHVYKIFKHFHHVNNEKLIECEKLWRKIESEKSLLRILDNNGGIKFERESHFDKILGSFCSKEFQKPARIIGETLVETKFGISDWFLNWRLIKMSEMKKIETIGELKEMRDFKVRISTYNTGLL